MTTSGERVRRAALELFAERGFHGTGIRQLAERAGLSSASLYHYMGTKEDLLVELMRAAKELLADTQGDTFLRHTGFSAVCLLLPSKSTTPRGGFCEAAIARCPSAPPAWQ